MSTTAPSMRDPGPAVVPDAELVERVLRGDDAACELVMRRYNRRMFRAARGIVTDDAEAEDVVQDAYVRAFSKIGQLEAAAGLGAWLTRIAVNEALGRRRRGRRVVFLEDHMKPGPDGHDDEASDDTTAAMTSPDPDPEKTAVNGELGRLLEDAIDQLPEDFRSVFMLRAVEGLSIAETAESLSLRPETVKTRFHRARKQLQQSLADRAADQLPAAFQFDGARCDRLVMGVLARLEQLRRGGPT